MKFNNIAVVIQAFILSTAALASEFADFNQNWVLRKNQAGDCKSMVSLNRSDFFGEDSLIFNRYFNENGYIQNIFKIGEKISSDGVKTITALEGQTITATSYKKGFLSNQYTKLQDKLEFKLQLPSLIYQYSNEKNQTVNLCEYEIKNPEFIKPPVYCSLFYNGQEVEKSSCLFQLSQDGKQQFCEIPAAATVEDTHHGGKYAVKQVYRKMIVSGPKRELLNLNVTYVVSYTVDRIDLLFNDKNVTSKDDLTAYMPVYQNEVDVHSWTDKNRLTIRCK